MFPLSYECCCCWHHIIFALSCIVFTHDTLNERNKIKLPNINILCPPVAFFVLGQSPCEVSVNITMGRLCFWWVEWLISCLPTIIFLDRLPYLYSNTRRNAKKCVIPGNVWNLARWYDCHHVMTTCIGKPNAVSSVMTETSNRIIITLYNCFRM